MKPIRYKWLILKVRLIQRLAIELEKRGLIEPDETEQRLFDEAINEEYGGIK